MYLCFNNSYNLITIVMKEMFSYKLYIVQVSEKRLESFCVVI